MNPTVNPTRRRIAATASLALVLGTTAGVTSAGTAAADPVSATAADSSSRYTRTMSDSTVRVGDTLTMTQAFSTVSGKDYVYEWRNDVDSCLDYVPGSATLAAGSAAPTPLPAASVTARTGATTVKHPSSSYWTFTQSAPHSFSLSYTVSPRCAADSELKSGFWYRYGSFSSKTYSSSLFQGGPSVRVVTGVTTSTSPVTASARFATPGTPVTLSATVTPSEQTALEGGVVRFRSGYEELCEGTVDAAGVATCTWTPDENGTYPVVARYEGAPGVASSTSQTPTEIRVVTAIPTAPTGLAVTPAAPSDADLATVSGRATPGTTVEVLGPGGTRCVAKVAAEGTFSCVLGHLPAGLDQTITARASADDITSADATATVTVTASRTLPPMGGGTGSLGSLGSLTSLFG